MTDEMIKNKKENRRMNLSYILLLIVGIILISSGLKKSPFGGIMNPTAVIVGFIIILMNSWSLWDISRTAKKKKNIPK